MRRVRGWAMVAAFVVMAAAGGIARGQVAAEGKKGAADAIPAEQLAVLLEFDGLDAHKEAWAKTSAHHILKETTTGAMLESLFTQIMGRMTAGVEGMPDREELQAIVRHVGRHGFAAGLCGPFEQPDQPLGVLVLRGAARPEARALFDRLVRGRIPRDVASREVARGERRITVVPFGEGRSAWAFWAEGADLILTIGQGEHGPETVIATLTGERPSAAKNPARAELRKREGGFEPAALAFVDFAALPNLPPQAREMGLGGIRRLDYRWGFEGEALLSVTRLDAPAPREGVLKLLDQPAFSAANLPPLPAGLANFALMAIDWNKVLDAYSAMPDGARAVDEISQDLRRKTGLRLREDVLATLGPRWAFYSAPNAAAASGGDMGSLLGWVLHPPRFVALAEVRDREGFARAGQALFKLANEQLRGAVGPNVNPPRIVPMKAPDSGFVLDLPPEVFPLPAGVQPALRIGDGFAALSISPKEARKALEAHADADQRAGLEAFGDRLVFLSRSDPKGNLPELVANIPFLLGALGRMGASDANSPPFMKVLASIRVAPELIPDPDAIRPFLFPSVTAVSTDERGLKLVSRAAFPGPSVTPAPATVPVLIALLLPAVQSAREAARRAQCMNNFKQIGLAFHNYHDTFNHFPAAAIASKDGKPLLSWRVAILPFIEQAGLYNEFHLDEPWDSPHNKPLIARMPPIYACPSGVFEPGMTPYQVIVGNRTAFEGLTQPHRIADFTDGTSNTLLAVEAKNPVIWTKPDDVMFDPPGFDRAPRAGDFKQLISLLGSKHPGGFNTLFTDGSVRYIRNSIATAVLNALSTRNGGEVISSDAY